VAPCAQLPLHSLRRLVLTKEQHVFCVRKHVHNFLKVDLVTDLYLYLLISLKNNPAHDFSHVYDSLDWIGIRNVLLKVVKAWSGWSGQGWIGSLQTVLRLIYTP